MRLIKRRDKQKPGDSGWWYLKTVKCGACGSELLLEKQDAEKPFWLPGSVRESDSGRYITVSCLHCHLMSFHWAKWWYQIVE